MIVMMNDDDDFIVGDSDDDVNVGDCDDKFEFVKGSPPLPKRMFF